MQRNRDTDAHPTRSSHRQQFLLFTVLLPTKKIVYMRFTVYSPKFRGAEKSLRIFDAAAIVGEKLRA